MKKWIILALLLGTAGQTLASTSPRNCSVIDQALAAAEKELTQVNQTIYDRLIPQPDFSTVKSCIDGIMGASGGFRLGIPSFSSLMNQACNRLRNEALNNLQKLNQDLQVQTKDGSVGVGVTGRAGGNGTSYGGIKVNDTSGNTAGNIWKVLK